MIVGKLTVLLGLDSKGFTTGISTATGKTSAFAKATDKTFKAISKAAKVGMLAVGAAFIKGAVDAAKFEKALANVSTMLDKNTMPMMKNFEKGILAMSEAYGESTDALAKGLYDILSASVPASQALDVLEISAKAAKAGLTDTGVAADAITTLMNSFGDSTKDANYYADIMFATVKFGKTTFAELAPVIGNVAKLMQVAGGSAEDMAGMLAIMTRNGIKTRVAVTSLRGVVNALIKPSEALTKELNGMTVKTDGFRAVMEKVGSLSAVDLAELFPNVRALTGVVVAAKDLGSEVDKINALMAEGSPTMTAYDLNMATFAATWDRFKATLKATSITLGNELLPTLKEMFENMIIWFQDNRENFADFAKIVLEQIRKLVTFVSDFKEVLLGAGSAILGLMVLSKVIPLMKLLGVTTSVSMGPIGLAVVAVGLLVGAFFKLRREMRELKDQEKLLDDAMAGDLKSTEDYNDAISLQQGKIKGLISTYMKQQEVIESRGEVRGRESDLAYKAHLERLKEARAELGIIRENSEEFKKIEEEKLKVEAENAQKELQLIYDKALETSNAEQEKRDEIAATADAVEEAISRTKGAMEGPLNNPFLETFDGAGFVAELYKVKEGVKTVEEVMDAFWEHEKNEAIDFDYVAKTSVEKFVDGWIETVEAVQEVFTLMYSALTGVTDQFFANKFAALEQDKATSDEFHNAEKEASDKIFKAKMKALDKLEDAGEDVSERRKDLMDEEEIANQALADAKLVSDKKLAKDKYDLELKQFKISKAMNIAQALMNTAEAVSKALTLGPILGLVMAGIVGALGAVQVGMIAGQAPPPAPFIRGGLTDKMIAGGAVRGNPGIDTNNVALTNREYVMPPQQSMDNFDELEDMRAGGTGGKNITIMPAQVDLIMNDRTVGTAVIEFMTAESDRGGFRINPKVLGALT